MNPTRFTEIMERAKRGELTVPENSGLDAQDGVEFALSKDDQGRDIARLKVSLAEKRERSWIRMIKAEGLPLELHPLEGLSEFQRKTIARLSNDGNNAILYGRVGAGKTEVALHAMRVRHMKGLKVVVVRFARVKRQFEPGWRDRTSEDESVVLARYTDPRYLLLDDVGFGSETRVPTEHERRVLLDIIDERDASKRPTWITSNQSPRQLNEAYGETLISRLTRKGRVVVVNFKTESNYRWD